MPGVTPRWRRMNATVCRVRFADCDLDRRSRSWALPRSAASRSTAARAVNAHVVHRRRRLRLRARLSLLQRVSRRQGVRARPDSRDAGRALQRRPRLRADEPLDRVRPSLRRDRGPRPADRPDARGAIRLPARHALDPDRRRARRLRAGFRRAVLLDPPRRPLARPDGARRARPDRRRGRADRRHGDHDHPDRGARPRRRERDAAQPVGDVDRRRDDSDRDPDRPVHAPHLRPGRVLEGTAIGVVLLLLAVFGGGWIDDQPDAARAGSTTTAPRSRSWSSSTASPRPCCRCGCCSRRATTSRRS